MHSSKTTTTKVREHFDEEGNLTKRVTTETVDEFTDLDESPTFTEESELAPKPPELSDRGVSPDKESHTTKPINTQFRVGDFPYYTVNRSSDPLWYDPQHWKHVVDCTNLFCAHNNTYSGRSAG